MSHLQKYGLVSHEEIHNKGVQPTHWDIEGILERDSGPTLITAAPEAYKSWFSLFACKSMVTGEKFLNHFEVSNPRPHAVYINIDAPANATSNRVAKIASKPIPNFYLTNWERWDDKLFAELLGDFRGAFVVVDCFSDMYSSVPGVEPAEGMRGFLRPIRKLYEMAGCNGIIVDHTPRSQRESTESFYGSVQKRAVIRQGITLKARGEGSSEVHCLKMSEAEKFAPFIFDLDFQPLAVNASYGGPVFDDNNDSEDRFIMDVGELRAIMKDQPDKSWSRKQLQDVTTMGRDRLLIALRDSSFIKMGLAKATKYSLG